MTKSYEEFCRLCGFTDSTRLDYCAYTAHLEAYQIWRGWK